MPQEMKHQDALRMAVETEKGLVCYYRRAAELVSDEGAKKVFTRLAKDKEEHAGQFFRHYQGHDMGTLEDFINRPCTLNADALKELKGLSDPQVKDRRAREIAMEKEKQLETSLRNTAKQIVNPVVRIIFEQMAKETGHHYEIIESEYARTMRMVHESDMNTYVRE
ncbi:MAG TPA: ferritin family protein [Malonomonas sp.]